MLKITILDSAREMRFRLEGRLSGPWVAELRQCWQTAASTTANRATVADLREVDFVDDDGRDLLADMHRAGVRLQAVTPLIQSVVEEACGAPVYGRVESVRPADAVLRADSSGSGSSTV